MTDFNDLLKGVEPLPNRIARLEQRMLDAEIRAIAAQTIGITLARKLTRHTGMSLEEWNSFIEASAAAVRDLAGKEGTESLRFMQTRLAAIYEEYALSPDEGPDVASPVFRIIDGGKSDPEA